MNYEEERMTTELRMPLLGDIMQEGTVAAWLVENEAWVEKGQPIFSVETDKAIVEVEAPQAGRLQQLAQAGDTVPVGSAVGLIQEGAALDPADDRLGASTRDPQSTLPLTMSEGSTFVARLGAPITAPTAGRESTEVRASPRARWLAREHGLVLERVSGTGPGGRIVEADIVAELARQETVGSPLEAAASAPSMRAGLVATLPTESTTAAAPSTTTRSAPSESQAQIVPLKGRRAVIAARMHTSLQTMAQLTIGQEIDLSALVSLRQQLVKLWEANEAVRVSYTDLVARAAALALRDHPQVNAHVIDDVLYLQPTTNIALAVDTAGGLTVPVIRSADERSFLDFVKEARRLTDLARADRLTQDDLAGGTFTVTAMGSYGVDWFTPIINPPQVAILGIGRIRHVPAIANGMLIERPVMNLCLTFDHRAIDGGPAARFLSRVAELLRTPVALL